LRPSPSRQRTGKGAGPTRLPPGAPRVLGHARGFPEFLAQPGGDLLLQLQFGVVVHRQLADHFGHVREHVPSGCAMPVPVPRPPRSLRLRTKVAKGPGSRTAGLAMVFKLIEAASERWRYVNGPHLVAT
jgi:putative transposase